MDLVGKKVPCTILIQPLFLYYYISLIPGVRRKRMKGDTWQYMEICDEIFKKAKL